jgi:hypothetical protein
VDDPELGLDRGPVKRLRPVFGACSRCTLPRAGLGFAA